LPSTSSQGSRYVGCQSTHTVVVVAVCVVTVVVVAVCVVVGG